MNYAHLSSLGIRWLSLFALALIVFAVQAPIATAQTAEFTQGSKNSNTMTFEVPLGSYPGRGISLPVTLRYSSGGLWRVGFINSVYPNVPHVPRSVAEAIYAEHSTSGWKTTLDVPKIEWPRLNDRYWADGKPYPRGYVYPNTYRVANVFVHMPDGSTHELRKADQVYQDNNYVDVSGTFYAVDGSRMRYDSSGETTGTLYLADGTRWIFNGSTVQYIDRNGNTLNYNPSTRQWTDTLGRVFNMPWPANPGAGDYTYQLPGVNASTLNYTIKFRQLSDALAPGTPALKPIGDYYLPNPTSPPTSEDSWNFPQPTGTATMFFSDFLDWEDPRTYTYVVGRMQYGANVFNPVVLSEVVLPNGQSYRFFYNNYGELAKVIQPTGGYQRYAYAPVPTPNFLQMPFDQGSRGLIAQWVSPTGTGTDEAQWTYETTGSMITVTAPDSTGAPNGTRSETHLHTNSAPVDNFGYQDARLGLPFEERIYAPQSQGGAMLRRTLIEYAQTSATFNRPSPYSGTYTAYRNARPTKSVSLMLDTGGNALANATTTSYDTTYQFSVGLDATALNEYGFAVVDQTTAQTAPISSMPFGPLERSTLTNYLTNDANYRNRNILGLVSSTTILNAYSQIVAQSAMTYDQTSLLSYGSVTGWTDPQTAYRGNPTSSSQWLDYPTLSWITNQAQYDQCGNIRVTTDALGNQSQVSYADLFSDSIDRNTFTFPTVSTSAVPDPTGTHGSNTPLVSSTVYDFNTGKITSSTDANAKTTTFEYNDPLNRKTRVNLPDGGRTTSTYVDAHACGAYIQTRTLLNASATETDSYTFFDGMGRPSRAFTYENQDAGNPYLTVDTQYDSLGRGWRSSNPYRSSGCTSPINPSGSWTTNNYDSLSRLISVTSPDGAQVSTAYSAVTSGSYIGPSVTGTDEAGKARRTINDAFGRVIQVVEDPNGLAYETNYAYDALNNLRRVEQGTQVRFYGYDSLSRVVRVSTVEQTVNPALSWTDPVTGNSSWTAGLNYDAHGNISARVDARNITTNYTYDALNRLITKLYRINGQPDPNTGDVEFLYDNAANGRGRPWITFTGGANPFQTAIGSYDAVGRITQIYRLFGNGQGGWLPAYGIAATYNLAGKITSTTYPSGRTVNYAYDASGRLSSFNGNLGGEQKTYASGIEYSPFGGASREQYGTQTPLYQKAFYNIRGQMFDKRLSSVNDTWDWNRGRLIWYYSSNYVWGGSGVDNNGNVIYQETWVPPTNATLDQAQFLIQDSYSYDSLNRLSAVNESSLNIGNGGSWQSEFAQVYNYDRSGNRTVDQTNTWGAVPKPNFGVNPATNQLTAPAGFAMNYDAAGNLTNDTYTGQGTRTYDAENRMKQAWTSNQWQSYAYDGGGQRIKRIENGVETWQIYGIGNELVAEYPTAAAPAAPQKEYGYRNGELLITAMVSSGWGPAPSYSGPNPLTTGNEMKLENLTELRSAVNQLRQHAGLAAYDFTVDPNPQPNVTAVKADHIRQLRTALEEARYALGLSTGGYAHPTLTENSSLIYAIDFQELRDQIASAWNTSAVDIRWLVTDRLGTPRMVFDQTGSYASVSRHDYLPFGEELSGVGGRTTGLGYTANDNVRQKFTGYERDAESGLDYAQARYYASQQGRFTSVDPLGKSANVRDPQSFNRYTYVLNNPTNFSDPTGMMPFFGAEYGWNRIGWYFGAAGSGTRVSRHIFNALVRHNSSLMGASSGSGSPPRYSAVRYFRSLGREFIQQQSRNFTLPQVTSAPLNPIITPIGLVDSGAPAVGPASGPPPPSTPAPRRGMPMIGLELSGFAAAGAPGELNIVDVSTNWAAYQGGVGASGSFGYISDPWFAKREGYPSTDAWGLGVGAALGPGIFFSNAQQFDPDFKGDFNNTAIILGVIMVKYSEGGGTKVLSFSEAWGFGVFQYRTRTFHVVEVPVTPLRNY